jgi:hypothetical protein
LKSSPSRVVNSNGAVVKATARDIECM